MALMGLHWRSRYIDLLDSSGQPQRRIHRRCHLFLLGIRILWWNVVDTLPDSNGAIRVEISRRGSLIYTGIACLYGCLSFLFLT